MNKKVKKKLILLILLTIIFVLTILNLHKIKFAFSMLNLYKQEKNAVYVSDSPEDQKSIIVDNPLQEIINSEGIVDNLQIPIDNSIDTKEKPKSTIPTSKPIKTAKKDYIDIVTEYNDKLETLRGTFELELNQLISQGIEQYNSGTVSTSKLASNLLSDGSKLEKTCDNKFDILVANMEKELKASSKDTAIIKEIRNYYSNFKNKQKQDIIAKGMKYVK